MSKNNFEFGAFRDPAGRIFYKENNVYREINKNGIKRFEFIKKDNLLNDLIDNGYLVDTKISEIDENKVILKHEKLNFISYPYEWTFTQLKDAALFHLDLQILVLKNRLEMEICFYFLLRINLIKILFLNLFPKYTQDFW